MNKIIMLRLYNGDYVMGEENPVQSDPGKTSLLNPRMFMFVPAGGQVAAGFRPVCIFDKDTSKEVFVSNLQIWLKIPEDRLPKEVLNGYKSEISGIEIADESDLAALDGASKSNGGFVI